MHLSMYLPVFVQENFAEDMVNSFGVKSVYLRKIRDWFSGHTQAVRMRNSVIRSPIRRYIVIALFLLSRSARAQMRA